MKKTYSKTTIKNVIGQVMNMFDNNVLADNEQECFCTWCEDGNVFAGEPDEVDCIDLMLEIAPLVDKITNMLVGLELNSRYHHIVDGTCFGEVMLKNERFDKEGNRLCSVYIGDNYDSFLCEVYCALDEDDEIIRQQLEEKLY